MLLEDRFVLGRVHVLVAQMVDRAGEEAARPRGWVDDRLPELRSNHLHHELGHRARRVELARIAGTLKLAEDPLVKVAELVAIRRVVEVDLLDLVHHLAQERAALHEVESTVEDTCNHPGAGIDRIRLMKPLKGWE